VKIIVFAEQMWWKRQGRGTVDLYFIFAKEEIGGELVQELACDTIVRGLLPTC